MAEVTRSCGECNVCCKLPHVEELNKPVGSLCTFCKVGSGCTIYERRPKACVSYQCQWLLGLGDEGDRPDKSKVLVDAFHYPAEQGLVEMGNLWEVEPDSFEGNAFATRIRNTLVRNKAPFVLHFLGQPMMLFVPQESSLTKTDIVNLVKETPGLRVFTHQELFARAS